MNRSGLISLGVLGIISYALLYVPYIEYHSIKSEITRNNRLIEDLMNVSFPFNLMPLTFLFPLLLSLEASYLTGTKTIWIRLLYVFQALMIFMAGFYIWFLMSFHLFVSKYEYQMTFYLVIIYFAILGIWNILLAIPFFDNNKPVSGTFRLMALIRKEYRD
jgi:hypothetical protein